MLRFAMLLLALVIALTVAPQAAAAAPAPPVFEHNGYLVSGPFYTYFMAHGGVATFGLPLTNTYTDPDRGLRVQLFEYAQLELHGEAILLGRLGNSYAAERSAEPAFQWRTPEATPPGYVFMPESGHTLGGAFGWYHQQHGGVSLLGYPISEEFVEIQPDGEPALVQYFERAVLRYTPAESPADPGVVERLPLGAWVAGRMPAERRAPGRPFQVLATATITYPVGTNDGANIELAAQRLHGAMVEPGAQLSFLTAIGAISEAAGYRRGTAIVNGKLVDNEVGGGICTVSTLLYRAAWAAGLPVTERRAHRYALRAYADAPGHDAAIYAPGQDLRFANTTSEPLFVALTAAHGTATLALWGRGDGRAVMLAPPQISDNGLTVQRSRTIRLADGRQWHEQVITRYEPLPPPASPAPVADTDAEADAVQEPGPS
jgi:hypothetical protein